MSIRALAIELYKAQQKVSGLERELENPSSHDHNKIREELRLARAEWKLLKKMLDGEKTTVANRPVPSSYGQYRW